MDHSTSNILLISGHPDLKCSIANRQILEQLQAIESISVHKLDETYADYCIDVPAEQARLAKADLIVIQFPLYWSTYPAIMKLWFDQVFSYNFAFGPQGDKLKQKKVILSITCGATESSYQPGEFNFLPLNDYLQAALHPIKAAQMDIVDQVITFEMNANPEEGGDRNTAIALSLQHAENLINSINNNNQ